MDQQTRKIILVDDLNNEFLKRNLLIREILLLSDKEEMVKKKASKHTSLGEMATGMAHELNNPLAVISLSIEETNEMIEYGEFEEIPKLLNKVLNHVQRCTKIMGHLRTFGRDDALQLQDFVLNNILEDTLMFFRNKLQMQKIELSFAFPEDLPQLRIDGYQIEQVFINLFQNAIHALVNTENAKITLSAKALNDLKMVEIRFQDNGPGIEASVLEKIFQPFYTTKVTGVGTGLGLSISYGIIGSNKGNILCESEMGKGTTFVIQLPQVVNPNHESKATSIAAT